MANNYEITYQWVGGKDGHYEVYVNGMFVESCDEGELNGTVKRLEKRYSSNETLKRELTTWCSKVLEAKRKRLYGEYVSNDKGYRSDNCKSV